MNESIPITTCPVYLVSNTKVLEAWRAYNFAHKDGLHQQLSQLEGYHPTLPADLVAALEELSAAYTGVREYEFRQQELKLKGK